MIPMARIVVRGAAFAFVEAPVADKAIVQIGGGGVGACEKAGRG